MDMTSSLLHLYAEVFLTNLFIASLAAIFYILCNLLYYNDHGMCIWA